MKNTNTTFAAGQRVRISLNGWSGIVQKHFPHSGMVLVTTAMGTLVFPADKLVLRT